MRFIVAKEAEALVKAGKGSQVIYMSAAYNTLVKAGVDMSINVFREIYMLGDHPDDRGKESILAADVEMPEDKR